MSIFHRVTSLQAKFVFSISSILVLTLSLLAVHVHNTQNQMLMDSLDNRVRTMGTFTSLISPEAIYAFDITTLDRFITQINTDPDIRFAVIVNAHGVPLTTVAPQDMSHKDMTAYLSGETPLPNPLRLNRYDIIHAGEKLGEVVIAVDLKRLNTMTRRNLGEHLLVSLLIIVFLASVIFFIFRLNVVRPVNHLISGANAVSKGVYTARVPVVSSDELGRLSKCFNHMATKISLEQSELQALNNELIHEVEVRREVERELNQAKEEAETANKAKSEFLANMSHELRTPLNSIIGFAEMMEYEIKGPLSDDYKEYSLLITNSGRLLLETVNSILDLAKIEAGKFELDTAPTSIAAILDDVITLLTIQATEKGIALDNNTANLHDLDIDPLRVRQVLINIIGNAIKFTHQGSVTITNRCDDKGHCLMITDTGIGMTPGSIDKALEPFRQVHGHSLARRYQGTGLGLSISKQIMELHGGTLSIHSTPEQGTEVTLCFPAKLECESVA